MNFRFKNRTISANLIESKKIADIVNNIVKHNKSNIKKVDEITQQIQERNLIMSQANSLIYEENIKLLAEQFETVCKPIIYDEVKSEIQNEFTQKFKNELKTEIQNEFTQKFKNDLKLEVENYLKNTMKLSVIEQLKQELRPYVKKDIKNELSDDIRNELYIELKPIVENSLKEILTPIVKKNLIIELKPIIENELKCELKDTSIPEVKIDDKSKCLLKQSDNTFNINKKFNHEILNKLISHKLMNSI
jgi:hypothetical protein